MAEYSEVYNMTDNATDLFTTTMTTMVELFNDSVTRNISSVGNSTSAVAAARPMGKVMLLVKVVYAIGIVGNACAIVALRRGERRVRNRKHLLLLTSLAANDLVALVSNSVFDLQRPIKDPKKEYEYG